MGNRVQKLDLCLRKMRTWPRLCTCHTFFLCPSEGAVAISLLVDSRSLRSHTCVLERKELFSPDILLLTAVHTSTHHEGTVAR